MYKATEDSPLTATLARAVQQRAPGVVGVGQDPTVRTQRVLARERRVLISGNQFGETYHVALAMIMSKMHKQPILPAWLGGQDEQGHTPTTGRQKTFLAKVYRWLNVNGLASVENIGTAGKSTELLSNNEASGAVATAIGGRTAEEIRRAMGILRMIFLSDPDLDLAMSATDRTRLAKEAAQDAHMRGVLGISSASCPTPRSRLPLADRPDAVRDLQPSAGPRKGAQPFGGHHRLPRRARSNDAPRCGVSA